MNPTPPVAPPRGSPAVLLIPFLFLVLGILWVRGRDNGPPGERPASPQERRVEPAVLWSGVLEFEGGRLVTELGALHLDPVRQEKDARILALRFDLPEGQPWRLRLRLEADRMVVLDPRELQLVSEGAARLMPLAWVQEIAGHPLLPLLAATPRPLGAAAPTDVILWGPEPAATARLEGLRGFEGAGSIEMARAEGIAWERLGELGLRRGEEVQ